MSPTRATRPTLKITRYRDADTAREFVFAVWNPFTGIYQPTASLADGLRRVDELASLIAQMHARRHPREAVLTDAPEPEDSIDAEWAEFRINPAGHRSYDTRRFDRRMWARSGGGKVQVTELICHSVGYSGRPAALERAPAA
jgi:hypothetical protein